MEKVSRKEVIKALGEAVKYMPHGLKYTGPFKLEEGAGKEAEKAHRVLNSLQQEEREYEEMERKVRTAEALVDLQTGGGGCVVEGK